MSATPVGDWFRERDRVRTHSAECWQWHPACSYEAGRSEERATMAVSGPEGDSASTDTTAGVSEAQEAAQDREQPAREVDYGPAWDAAMARLRAWSPPGGYYADTETVVRLVTHDVLVAIEPVIRAAERERIAQLATERIERLAASAQETAVAHALKAERERLLTVLAETGKDVLAWPNGYLVDAVPWARVLEVLRAEP